MVATEDIENNMVTFKEPRLVEEATDRIKDILGAKCAPVSAEQMLDASSHLSTDKKNNHDHH